MIASCMAQLLIRDVPQGVVDALKQRAARNGRSAEAEHRLILEQATKPELAAFIEAARRLREETRGRIDVESWALIRQDRDER